MATRWLLLQMADSAFPAGGFAHSGGLEAAAQLGYVGSSEVTGFVCASLWQVGRGALPFVSAAHDDPAAVGSIDATCDAFLTSAVQNRASRTQGRSFIATCARIFDDREIAALDEAALAGTFSAHFAPLFGVTARALGASRSEAQDLFLHLALRGLLSAAVRLGVVGPHQAQRIQHARAATLDDVLGACRELTLDDVAQTSPLVELMGSTQDRLYSRLFQS